MATPKNSVRYAFRGETKTLQGKAYELYKICKKHERAGKCSTTFTRNAFDNIVFRLFSNNAAARQIVGHIYLVNNKCVSIASYQCQPGDVLTIKDSKASRDLVLTFLENPALSNIPQHLDFDKKSLTAKVLSVIDREWVALKLNELFVIEFYSRKI